MLIELSEGKLKEMIFQVRLEDNGNATSVILLRELDGSKICDALATISDSSAIKLGEIEKIENEWRWESCHEQTKNENVTTQKKRILAIGKLIEKAIDAQTRKNRRDDLQRPWRDSLVVSTLLERIESLLAQKNDFLVTLPKFREQLADFTPGNVIHALTSSAETMLVNAHLYQNIQRLKESIAFFSRDDYTTEEIEARRGIALLASDVSGRVYVEKLNEIVASHREQHTEKLCRKFRWSNGNVMNNLSEQSERNASSEFLEVIERLEWKLDDTLSLFK